LDAVAKLKGKVDDIEEFVNQLEAFIKENVT
jgi:hypothetical protein